LDLPIQGKKKFAAIKEESEEESAMGFADSHSSRGGGQHERLSKKSSTTKQLQSA